MLGGGLPAGLLRSAGRAGRRSLCNGEPACAAASASEREQRPLRAMAAGTITHAQLRVSVALLPAQQLKRRRAPELVGATRQLKRDRGANFVRSQRRGAVSTWRAEQSVKK